VAGPRGLVQTQTASPRYRGLARAAGPPLTGRGALPSRSGLAAWAGPAPVSSEASSLAASRAGPAAAGVLRDGLVPLPSPASAVESSAGLVVAELVINAWNGRNAPCRELSRRRATAEGLVVESFSPPGGPGNKVPSVLCVCRVCNCELGYFKALALASKALARCVVLPPGTSPSCVGTCFWR